MSGWQYSNRRSLPIFQQLSEAELDQYSLPAYPASSLKHEFDVGVSFEQPLTTSSSSSSILSGASSLISDGSACERNNNKYGKPTGFQLQSTDVDFFLDREKEDSIDSFTPELSVSQTSSFTMPFVGSHQTAVDSVVVSHPVHTAQNDGSSNLSDSINSPLQTTMSPAIDDIKTIAAAPAQTLPQHSANDKDDAVTLANLKDNKKRRPLPSSRNRYRIYKYLHANNKARTLSLPVTNEDFTQAHSVTVTNRFPSISIPPVHVPNSRTAAFVVNHLHHHLLSHHDDVDLETEEYEDEEEDADVEEEEEEEDEEELLEEEVEDYGEADETKEESDEIPESFPFMRNNTFTGPIPKALHAHSILQDTTIISNSNNANNANANNNTAITNNNTATTTTNTNNNNNNKTKKFNTIGYQTYPSKALKQQLTVPKNFSSAKPYKVFANSNPRQIAAIIAHASRQGDPPVLLAVGKAAINQAVKAMSIARSFLMDNNIDIICYPGMRDPRYEALRFRLVITERTATKEMDEHPLKVSKDSNVCSLAGAIAKSLRSGSRVCVNAVGVCCVSLAVLAITRTRKYMKEESVDVSFRPQFVPVSFNDSKANYHGLRIHVLSQQL